MNRIAFLFLFGFNLCWTYSNAQNPESTELFDKVFNEEFDVPGSYTFDKSVGMKLETFKAADTSSIVYTMRYTRTGGYICMSPTEIDGEVPYMDADVIVEFEKKRMITLVKSSSPKLATVFPIKEATVSDGNFENSTTFTKTGSAKQILGYDCIEYEISGSNVSGYVWLAPTLDLNLARSFQALGIKWQLNSEDSNSDPIGFIMAFETMDEVSGKVSKMEVVEINLRDAYSIKTEGFLFTSLPPVKEELKQD